jgi:hypothetical protein
MVMGRVVGGAIATGPEMDAGSEDKGVDCRFDQARRGRGSGNGDCFGQVLTLRRVETGEALQEGDCLWVIPVSRTRRFSSSGTKRSA